MNLTLPTVHWNGTAKERLIEDLCTASAAIDAAYDALRQTAPNGRDYYPQGLGALEKATAEHLARLKKIDEVKAELDWLTLEINKLSR